MLRKIIKNVGVSIIMYVNIIIILIIAALIIDERNNIAWIDSEFIVKILDLKIMAITIVASVFVLSVVDASNLESDRIIKQRQKIKEREEKAKKEEGKAKENKKSGIVRETVLRTPETSLTKARDNRLEQQLEMVRQNRMNKDKQHK